MFARARALERGAVDPVEVIDEQTRRPGCGDIRHQPTEVTRDADLVDHLLDLTEDERPAPRRRAGRLDRRITNDRLEQLADHAVQPLLRFRPAGPEHAEASLACAVDRALSSAVFPMPAAPSNVTPRPACSVTAARCVASPRNSTSRPCNPAMPER